MKGQLLIFSSYLAHRSGPNTSSGNRKAIYATYATYNCAREGDLHKEYHEDRKKLWPATHMRQEGENYDEGALRYGFVINFPFHYLHRLTRPEVATPCHALQTHKHGDSPLRFSLNPSLAR